MIGGNPSLSRSNPLRPFLPSSRPIESEIMSFSHPISRSPLRQSSHRVRNSISLEGPFAASLPRAAFRSGMQAGRQAGRPQRHSSRSILIGTAAALTGLVRSSPPELMFIASSPERVAKRKNAIEIFDIHPFQVAK